MPTVSEAIEALTGRVLLGKAAGWDPTGLQVGDPSAQISSVAVCHEVSEHVLGEVEPDPPGLLITYHPLLFRPTTRLVAGRSPAGRAFRLARAGVALATVHTAFDAAPGGTADTLAGVLGLIDRRGLAVATPAPAVKVVTFVPEGSVEAVASAMAAAGAGVIGNYGGCSFRTPGTGAFLPGEDASPVVGARLQPSREPETKLEMIAPESRMEAVVSALVASHPYEEPAYDVFETRSNMGFVGRVGNLPDPVSLGRLVGLVSDVLGAGGLRASGDRTSEVGRVAVVPGSGGSFVPNALAAGAEVLVTGDVPHHSVVESLDGGMGVIDPGHAPTERPGMAALVQAVAETVPAGIGVTDLTGLDPTPWR